jgi:hypothetical protein
MTDKEKYTALMQRYWNAETTPGQEQELARYAARVDDPDFDGIRGVLGYLSIGRYKNNYAPKIASTPWQRIIGLAAAAVLAAVCGTFLYERKQASNTAEILASMESTLTAIFSSGTDIETELSDILNQ